MNKTGYQIQFKADRTNAFSEDANQVFRTLEEARSWSDSVWEQQEQLNSEEEDESCKTKKANFIVAYYENGVQRGEYPLFV